jgi:hypothetical protein
MKNRKKQKDKQTNRQSFKWKKGKKHKYEQTKFQMEKRKETKRRKDRISFCVLAKSTFKYILDKGTSLRQKLPEKNRPFV